MLVRDAQCSRLRADERCDRDHSTCDGRTELCIGRGPAWPDHFRSNDIIARRQTDMALHLWRTANISVTGAETLSRFLWSHHTDGAWAFASLISLTSTLRLAEN